MLYRRTVLLGSLGLLGACTVSSGTPSENAQKRVQIDAEVDQSLKELMATSPAANSLVPHAKGILVFPKITKGGFIVGGQGGDGALRRGGMTTGYFSVGSASFGLQAGVQTFAQALFFMTDEALRYLDTSKGFEVGVDGTVAVADVGRGGDLSSTTLQSPIIAFVYGQQGLMAGISLEGSKITRLNI
jgi:lipid-binding SYLF domain-containing protein